MIKRSFLLLLAALLPVAAPAAPAPHHDLYICAGVNKGYVIGSRIVTTNGLFKQNAQGEWDHFGYNDTSIRSFVFDPRDHQVIYTAANNGCWRTLDGGKTWRITTSWDMTEPPSVTLDPHAPDTVYLALPDGIAVSTDRAQTWERRENGLPDRGKYTQVVQVDRTQEGRVLAGCEVGIFLTEDAGRHWRRVQPTDTTVDDIRQSPHDPSWWIAATQSNGAFVSRDGGRTWKPIEGIKTRHSLYNVAFDPTNPKRIAMGGYVPGVLTSEDGGETWTARNAGLPEGRPVWRVAVSPDTGRLYVSVSGEALFTSEDFGRTWKREGLESSGINDFVFLPANP